MQPPAVLDRLPPLFSSRLSRTTCTCGTPSSSRRCATGACPGEAGRTRIQTDGESQGRSVVGVWLARGGFGLSCARIAPAVVISVWLLAVLRLTASGAALPHPAHVVLVIEENKSLAQIDGNRSAPYLNGLIRSGALFTNSHGVTHPSLPNYFALFAGLTNDNGDGCPATGVPPSAPNLASELLASRLTFAAYSEGLPQAGWKGCAAGRYGRKHAPWVHFTNVPGSLQLPLRAFPKFDRLPALAVVVPDLDDDMHDGTIEEGDVWLARNLGPLVAWASRHDTLIVVTWDEGFDPFNTVPTIFAGPMVKPGRYREPVNHYRVLRTLEDLERLPHVGRSTGVTPISDCWRSAP